MPRLFIRHKPVDCVVEDSVNDGMFYVAREILLEHRLSIHGYNNVDVAYVCIVEHGKCWAARSFELMGNKQIRIRCVSFDDDPSGQQMVLADIILN